MAVSRYCLHSCGVSFGPLCALSPSNRWSSNLFRLLVGAWAPARGVAARHPRLNFCTARDFGAGALGISAVRGVGIVAQEAPRRVAVVDEFLDRAAAEAARRSGHRDFAAGWRGEAVRGER